MMSKVTTADCKKFLVAEITKNPNIIHDIYNDSVTAIDDALKEKNWKRESKFNPVGDNDYADYSYSLWCPRMGPGRGQVKDTDLVAVRRFFLLPDKYEDAIGFNVLEDHQGNLHLGAYIGD
jgi:hypothetical protein